MVVDIRECLKPATGDMKLRGAYKATMELKISQELAIINQDPLFLVFLDLRQVYNTVDRSRLIRNLEGYGTVPHV